MVRKEMNLREERDFGQKFNAVFTFLQINFKSFFKIILLIVGPLVLLGGVFFGMFYSKLFGSLTTGMGMASYADGGMLVEMGIAYFMLGLASLWLMIVVYAYMAEYLKGNRDITIEAVWNRGKSKILPSLGFGILALIAMSLFAGIIFVIPGNGTGAMILKVLLVYIMIFYVMITLSMTVPNMVIEDEGVFESIGRSFTLIAGKWWSTFGLLFVMGIVSGVATGIFSMPLYAVLLTSIFLQTGELSEFFTILSSVILFLGAFLVSTLPTLAIGFQYFNLVERKDGTGLLEKIDQLGKTVNNVNEGDY